MLNSFHVRLISFFFFFLFLIGRHLKRCVTQHSYLTVLSDLTLNVQLYSLNTAQHTNTHFNTYARTVYAPIVASTRHIFHIHKYISFPVQFHEKTLLRIKICPICKTQLVKRERSVGKISKRNQKKNTVPKFIV